MNGRPVADPVLKGAVRVAYRDVIAVGRHPVVALWLDLPPDELDVNVHPAKTELRFRDPAAVRSLVIGSIGRALAGGAGTALPAPRPVAAPDALARPAGAYAIGAAARHGGDAACRSAPRRRRACCRRADAACTGLSARARRWRRCWTPT